MSDLLGKQEPQNVVEPKLSKKDKQKKLQEELADLEKEVDEIPPVDESVLIEKPKKPRSAKQMETLARANEIRKENVKIRLEQRQKEEVEQKKVNERKIIDKAIKLKRKQIRHVKVLEESDSDSDGGQAPHTPVASIKKPVPRSIQPIIVPERKIRFV
jgi:hypothetical protein